MVYSHYLQWFQYLRLGLESNASNETFLVDSFPIPSARVIISKVNDKPNPDHNKAIMVWCSRYDLMDVISGVFR